MLMYIKTYAALKLIFWVAFQCPNHYPTGDMPVYNSIPTLNRGTNYFNQKFETPVTGNKLSDDTTNKKYPTFWGGDISFWKNDSSYGYRARGLGQEIFKDNNTKIIEKLVTPWLLLYTNQYRKAHGLDTLQYDQCLLKAAAFQTNYLFNESKINHQFKLDHYQDSSSQWFTGISPSDRALTAGCKKYCGENALYTNIQPIPEKDKSNLNKLNLAAQKIARNMVFDQWHHSKGHRENMLNKGFSILGVSVAIGKHYSNDYYINDKGEKELIGDSNTVSWIAFGIQVMAY